MQRKARSRASSFSEDDGGSSRSPTPPGGRAVRRKRSSSFSDNHMPTRRRSASFSEVVGSAFNTTAALFRRNTRSFFYHDSIESEDEDTELVQKFNTDFGEPIVSVCLALDNSMFAVWRRRHLESILQATAGGSPPSFSKGVSTLSCCSMLEVGVRCLFLVPSPAASNSMM